MYNIKRTEKFTDTINLVKEDGTAARTLTVTIDIDKIADGVRKTYIQVIEAERQLHATAGTERYHEALAHFGTAVHAVMEFCFGTENARIISEFFGGDYIEISIAIIPYIYNTIIPKTTEAIIRRRNAFKAAFSGKRRHK